MNDNCFSEKAFQGEPYGIVYDICVSCQSVPLLLSYAVFTEDVRRGFLFDRAGRRFLKEACSVCFS